MVLVSRNLRHAATALLCAAAVGCGSDDGDSAADVGMKRDGLISFTPIYSAFGGGQEYQITPYVPLASDTADPATDPIDPASIKWKIDDKFLTDLGEFPDLPGGRKYQTKRDGATVISVSAKTKSGALVNSQTNLTISPASEEEWAAGDNRYSNGTTIDWAAMFGRGMGGAPPAGATGEGACGLPFNIMGMIDSTSSCTNCHNAMNVISVQHTPAQTAGYSNEELIQIFTQAKKPGGKFNSMFLKMFQPAMAECLYMGFHTWMMDEDQKKGIVWKLRSIPPAKQTMLDIGRIQEAAAAARAANASAAPPAADPAAGGAAGAAP